MHSWINKLAFLASKTRCKFFSLTETPEDYTIIVDEEGFKALNVVPGGGNASNSQPIGVTKIAKSVIAPLADHNISVRERDLPLVMHTLSSEFTLLRVVNGETVAVHDLGVTNGFCPPHHPPALQPQQHVLCDESGPRHAALCGHAAHGRHVLLLRCGIVAQISEPLATADIPAYYISTFKFDHAW
ncbi:hypothetical protein F7725_006464 [Dissostichus mawsoni]|uniref:CASTOR1 N-terminal domain-containing protein n=1 Tax=Dissostichus mawsoni TaxID=36200 RepID=A0A7J5XU23_DISMA|nr:hypothetical protein F7725_006464 [Dissostichus mawsoni]